MVSRDELLHAMIFKAHPILHREISNTGLIRKVRGTGYMKLATSRTGYRFTRINEKGYYVHRLVWEAFNGPIPLGLQVNHVDGDKSNNNLSNLELVTPSQNIRHAHDTGLKSGFPGESNGNAKYSNQGYLDIIQMIVDGKTNAEIAEVYNLSSRYISLVRHKRRLRSIWKEYEHLHGKVIPINSGGHSKLCLEDQLKVISLLSDHSNKTIADQFKVDPSVISLVRSQKIWAGAWQKHLESSTTSRKT